MCIIFAVFIYSYIVIWYRPPAHVVVHVNELLVRNKLYFVAMD